MPIATIQTPEGQIVKIEVPDGATEQQIMAFVESSKDEIMAMASKRQPRDDVPEAVEPTGARPVEPLPENPLARFLQKSIASAKASGSEAVTALPRQLEAATMRATAEGLINAAAGPGQVMAGLHGRNPADVAGGAEALKQAVTQPIGPSGPFAPIEAGLKTIAEASPYMAAGGPANVTIPRVAGREAGIGAVSGFTGYIPGEEEGISEDRIGRAVMGGAAGFALPVIIGAGGKVVEDFSPRQAPRIVAEGVPKPKLLSASKLAKDKGIYVDPAAGVSDAALSDRARIRLYGMEDRAQVEEMLNRSTKGAKRLVSEFFSDILPEGTPSQVQAQVTNLFNDGLGNKVPGDIVAEMMKMPAVQDALNVVAKSRTLRQNFLRWPSDSFGRMNILRKIINKDISVALKAQEMGQSYKSHEIEGLYEAKDFINEAMRRGSLSFQKALDMSHREHIIRNLGRQYGLSKKTIDKMDEIPAIDIYNSFFKKDKVFNQLVEDLSAIKDIQRRNAAVSKAHSVRNILSRYSDTKRTVDQIIKNEAPEIEPRGKLEALVGYTTRSIMQRTQGKAIIDYILDGQADEAVLRQALESRNPKEFALGMASALSRISSKYNIEELNNNGE